MFELVMEKYGVSAKVLAFFSRIALVLGLLFAASAYAQTSEAAPLRIELGVDGQAVIVTLHNDSAVSIAFLPWGTPFGVEVDADVLRIQDLTVLPTLDYELSYRGLLFKRGAPVARNLITISAGQSIATRVTPADHYEVDFASNYRVEYRGDIRYTASISELKDQTLSVSSLLQAVSLQSAGVELALDIPPQTRAAVAPTFASCSVSEVANLQSALSSAESLASDASTALRSLGVEQRSNSPRYARWFGAFSESRFNTVNEAFGNLHAVLENTRIDFACGCTREGTFAFVNRSRPFEINLCPQFWAAPEIGRDSRAGTIIHELSHFSEIIGTSDFKYGQADVTILATERPDQAIFNADSYEYFAENTPALPIAGDGAADGIVLLPLDVEQSGSLKAQQSQYFTVSGAQSIEITSVNGDVDLYVFRALSDQTAICESVATEVKESCPVDSLSSAIVRVFAFTDSAYRVVAHSGAVVSVQGGDAVDEDNGGSMSMTLFWLAIVFAWFRRRQQI